MKKLIFTSVLIFFLYTVNGQLSLEIQTGGSNFIGTTVNASYKIIPIKEYKFSIYPSIGVGSMFLPDFGLDAILHSGIESRYKKWGLGLEFSHFFTNPLIPEHRDSGFVDFIIYPNVSFMVKYRESLYLKLSTGAYFAFSSFSNLFEDSFLPRYHFEGDIIPGAGITIGYTFFTKKS